MLHVLVLVMNNLKENDMIMFREHSGGFDESMEKKVGFDCVENLMNWLKTRYSEYETINTSNYCYKRLKKKTLGFSLGMNFS